tara:strand:- start:506 stop:775 length:270 start_codon:yes stop_codon:yes gene_type:complete
MKDINKKDVFDKIGSLSKKSLDRVNKYYRDKAIKETKNELRIRQKKWSDYSDREIEEIIAEKEKEVRSKHKMTGLKLALLPLGLGWFIN